MVRHYVKFCEILVAFCMEAASYRICDEISLRVVIPFKSLLASFIFIKYSIPIYEHLNLDQ